MKFKFVLIAVAIVFAPAAWGQAVITLPDGNVSLGVGAFGALGNCAGSDCSGDVVASGTPGLPATSNDPGYPYGIYLKSQNADSVTPGCFCEGWGAAYNGTVQGNSSNSNGGNTNITGVSFASTSSTATSVVTIGGLKITQAYAPAAGALTALFKDTVTITNTGATTLNNVEYARSTDWDINPTEFHEIETLGGWGATALTYSVNNGFCTDNPLTLASSCGAIGTTKGSAWTNTNFTQNGIADQGSSFLFNFGSLAAGGSDTFDIYYGAADNNAAALAALGGVGAEVYVLGYASNGPDGTANLDSGTWMFGFSGVGGKPITATPEPGTLSLCGIGLLGLAKSLRKRSLIRQ